MKIVGDGACCLVMAGHLFLDQCPEYLSLEEGTAFPHKITGLQSRETVWTESWSAEVPSSNPGYFLKSESEESGTLALVRG
jgi:hypothetical protein